MTGALRRPGVRYCVSVFLATRLGFLVLGVVGPGLLPLRSDFPQVPGWPVAAPTPGLHNAIEAWEREDAAWFLRIADSGYAEDDGSAVFFPLYPMAIRAVSWVIGDLLVAGLLVANLAFLAALLVMYSLAASELSEGTARRAVLYASLFPTSFFFFAPYSESLFLFLAVSAFWAARRKRWALAALAAALAALTRNVGLVLAPVLALEALHQRREDPDARLGPGLLASASVGLGTLAYLATWKVRSGDWLAPLHLQSQWLRSWTPPWRTLAEAIDQAFHQVGVFPGGYWLVDLVVFAAALSIAVAGLRWLRPSLSAFALVCLAVPLFLPFTGRALLSVPRFVLVIFPLYLVLAEASERGRIPHAVIVGVGAAGLGLLTPLFLNWYYIF